MNSIEKIFNYTNGLDFDAFLNDSKTIEAVEKNFEIIGEAANQLTNSFRNYNPEIPWHSVISFRNRLIHGYFWCGLSNPLVYYSI